MSDNNPHLRKLDQIQEVKEKFNESEWRLDFLRCIEPQPTPQPNNDELLQWNNPNSLAGLN